MRMLRLFCRAETVRSALDVLAICCVIPSVPVVFCDRMDLPDEPSAAGINFILGASEGEINADAEVQKSALAVLVHCVCAPINTVIFIAITTQLNTLHPPIH